MYYQLNIDTIIEKYCVNKERPKLNCNGKCYLMTQMKMSKTTSDTKNSSLKVIVEAFIPLFFEDNTIQIENILKFYSEDNSNWKLIHFHPKNVSKSIDHPPEIYFS